MKAAYDQVRGDGGGIIQAALAGENARRESRTSALTYGFSGAEDKVAHAKGLVSQAFAEEGFKTNTHMLVEGVTEGNTEKTVRGGVGLVGNSSQVILLVAGAVEGYQRLTKPGKVTVSLESPNTQGATTRPLKTTSSMGSETLNDGLRMVEQPLQPSRPAFRLSKSDPAVAGHAKMVERAQQGGQPRVLEGGDGGRRFSEKNRYQAQKEIRRQQGGPKQGYDYDEFPYAASKQGGAGAHVEEVLSEVNQEAGRRYGRFLQGKNSLKRKLEPGEKHIVIIDP